VALDNLPGPQVVLLVSAVLLVRLRHPVALAGAGPRSDDAGYVLSALPVVETFLLLPALLAAWLGQSLHLLRQLRDLRPHAEAISLLQSEVAALQARLERGRKPPWGRLRTHPQRPAVDFGLPGFFPCFCPGSSC